MKSEVKARVHVCPQSDARGGEQLFDFMESTSWPVRSIDVELMLGCQVPIAPSDRQLLELRSPHARNLDIAKSKQAPRFVRFSQMRLLSTGRPPKALVLNALKRFLDDYELRGIA